MAKTSKKTRSTEPKKRNSRPSIYSAELADRICAELSAGRSLRSICQDEGMPDRDTVMRWAVDRADFHGRYARARDVGIDTIAELAVDEATSNVAYEDVAAARLKFDARRWYVGKLAPNDTAIRSLPS